MSKATHSGTCQCCGRPQKLPGGVLSKHGYTVRCGFFEGTCQGTGCLPYEQSCGLIKQFVAAAKAQKDRIQAKQAELRKPATTALAWVQEYIMVPARRWGTTGRYEWSQKELTMTTHPLSSGSSYTTFHYTPAENAYKHFDLGKLDGGYGEDKATTPMEMATIQNRKYAATFDKTVKEIDSYVKWQTKRITDWKLTDLTPVK